MTTILTIDPGSAQSAWLQFDGTRPEAFGITANDVLAKALRSGGLPDVVVARRWLTVRSEPTRDARKSRSARGPWDTSRLRDIYGAWWVN